MEAGAPPQFTLRQLAYFVAAAETGSTTQAAAQFVMTQSAMSAALYDLERAVGTQLLVRYRGRGLELTASGRALVPRARELLRAADDLQGAGGGARRRTHRSTVHRMLRRHESFASSAAAGRIVATLPRTSRRPGFRDPG
ncbi:hypothetical protein BST36_21125 [Mycolicibacterium moriokaense]|uniref:LysR family transcriptional regulator n=1 Tax=Mycolicibacterium moriokaense TaxID=39691 RepID=UPI000A0AEB6C|nr:hypothetical protein BST36_21125 [Mycolicibacterium moriokaense]